MYTYMFKLLQLLDIFENFIDNNDIKKSICDIF